MYICHPLNIAPPAGKLLIYNSWEVNLWIGRSEVLCPAYFIGAFEMWWTCACYRSGNRIVMGSWLRESRRRFASQSVLCFSVNIQYGSNVKRMLYCHFQGLTSKETKHTKHFEHQYVCECQVKSIKYARTSTESRMPLSFCFTHIYLSTFHKFP
jgi:hypothetical protein